MPSVDLYKERISKELQIAYASRKQGNEGRARVCARRAVGIALTFFFESTNEQVKDQDAMDLLKHVQSIPEFPPELQQSATRLTARIGADFQYTSNTDPLEDAKAIIEFIFKIITQ